MIDFLKAFFIFVRMYLDGFYFSKNTHIDYDGTRWGFYRFNYKDIKYGIIDIDFQFSKNRQEKSYFHVHTYETIYRLDL